MTQRKLLMIPGPIEFTPQVLHAMGKATTSHVAPDFVDLFGRVLERLREVFASPGGQPFVLAGSGTLAMDMAAANLIESGQKALVVNTGYFGDRYGALLERYGAEVTHVRAPAIGDAPAIEEVEAALNQGRFHVMTITHVDTSTAVAADVKALCALGRRHGALVIVDGVCSVGGEEMRQEEWGIDVALTASQKALGVPPGLAIVMAGPRAMEAFEKRKTRPGNYYADWTEWLPIMKAYEARQPSYFGTPPVNLICALDTSLGQILEEGLDARFARHKRLSALFKDAMKSAGLRQVPVSAHKAASTMTALYYPDGQDASLLGRIAQSGVILAGGLHPEIKARTFRIGHMGAVTEEEITATISAIKKNLGG